MHLREQESEGVASLLRVKAGGVSSDRSVDALISRPIVVLPDSDHLLIIPLPAPDQSRAMTDLDRQQVAVKEVVECSKPLGNRDIATNAVEHARTIDALPPPATAPGSACRDLAERPAVRVGPGA